MKRIKPLFPKEDILLSEQDRDLIASMWPEGSNPEFFPSLKAARAAIARATGGTAS